MYVIDEAKQTLPVGRIKEEPGPCWVKFAARPMSPIEVVDNDEGADGKSLSVLGDIFNFILFSQNTE